MSTIYVLNKDGKPLMPTTRGGHVRHMARSTNWLSHLPFTEKVGDSNSPRVPICFCSSVGRAVG